MKVTLVVLTLIGILTLCIHDLVADDIDRQTRFIEMGLFLQRCTQMTREMQADLKIIEAYIIATSPKDGKDE